MNPPDTTQSRSRIAVLVIEDDPDHQFLIRTNLTDAGYHVELCASLHDALDLLAIADNLFDIIVADLDLPDDDGTSSLDLLTRATPIPVIVHSAADRLRLDRALRNGAVAAIPKTAPGPETLTDAIERVIADRDHLDETAALDDADLASRDYRDAANALLVVLPAMTGIDTWMLTRVVDDNWQLVCVNDQHYDLHAGDVLRWSDSFCCRMVNDARPRIVPDTTTDPVYDDAPIGHQIRIGAYVGLPIAIRNEGLFGTVCGIQPHPHRYPEHLAETAPQLAAIAATLATAIAADLHAARLQRRLDVAETAARCDLLTGLGNRRAWDRALKGEQARSDRFGHQTGIAVIDLDHLKIVNDTHGHIAGDRLIRETAAVLRTILRRSDTAYRIGGDEFAVLLPETNRAGVHAVEQRIATALHDAGIAAAVGTASRSIGQTLGDTAVAADRAMYLHKRRQAPTT